MSIPAAVLTSTCDVYRPFGAGSATTAGIPCRLEPNLAVLTGKLVVGQLGWTHTLDVQPGVDIRDGASRADGSASITFADGDEVRVPGGTGTTRYVVVWVETIGLGTPMQFQRAYLLRHEAVFPNP
jgi:hypothetical protein